MYKLKVQTQKIPHHKKQTSLPQFCLQSNTSKNYFKQRAQIINKLNISGMH